MKIIQKLIILCLISITLQSSMTQPLTVPNPIESSMQILGFGPPGDIFP